MRILITGGAGYIGSHTAVNVLKDNHDLFILDDFSNSSKDTLDRIKQITNKNFEFTECNITEQCLLKKIFIKFKPEIVIHCAGFKSVEMSIKYPLNYYSNNIIGTINLLEAMNNSDCQKIVFSSSATVYGIPIYSPCDENHQISPINPYGKSKYFNEEIIKDWVISQKENKAIILRYFNPVGAHKSGIIGENPKGIPNNLLPYVAGVITGKYKYLSVYGKDYNTRDGTGVRDFIHVEDIAKAHVSSFKLLNNKIKSEIINLGTGVGFSVLEIIKEFENTIQKTIPFEIKKRRPGDVAELVADNKKAKLLLNWETSNSLHDICKDTIRWINNESI